MPRYAETPSPTPGQLHCSHWDSHGVVHGWRSRGSKDWLLLYTAGGRCLLRCADGEFVGEAGDFYLYQPGTPQDYGQRDPRGDWHHVWVHWVPRAETIEWLAWPEVSRGLRHLHLPPEMRRPVLREFILADAAVRGGGPRAEDLALNAVERALLLSARANPHETNPRWNPRIQQAADHLSRNLAEPLSLEKLASRFGFSRSRFAALFHQQTGQPPGRFLESRRLVEARHLLIYTKQTLSQIAEQTGFSSPFYLSLRFKQHYGKSPRDLRTKS